MRVQYLRPEYVEYIPRDMVDGTLYISKKFKTASHRCCCGCGTKIVTPLRETEYALTERGGQVSLRPSIGNWNHPCQSHYWVRDNQIVWAGRMSRRAIRRGRAYDDDLKRAYFVDREQVWWRRAGSWLRGQLRNLFG
jgi:Family of unknown function (DUF6527)